MSDPQPALDSGDEDGRYPGTPGWVKALGVIVLVLVLLAAIIVATGLGGPHGPQRHGGGDAPAPSPLG